MNSTKLLLILLGIGVAIDLILIAYFYHPKSMVVTITSVGAQHIIDPEYFNITYGGLNAG